MSMEPTAGDAFGSSLIEALADGGAASGLPEIVERSDGFISTGRLGRYFDTYDDWQPRDRWAIGRTAGRVLDLGAGAGRIALHLQGLGASVLALDNSPGAIEVCRSRGVRETFLGTIADLEESAPEPFDTFALLGNNLGLIESGEQAHAILGCLARLATPDARIIATAIDAYDSVDPDHLMYHAQNRLAGRMGSQLQLRIRHRNVATPWFDYLMPSLAELDEILTRSDWIRSETFTDGPQYATVLEFAKERSSQHA